MLFSPCEYLQITSRPLPANKTRLSPFQHIINARRSIRASTKLSAGHPEVATVVAQISRPTEKSNNQHHAWDPETLTVMPSGATPATTNALPTMRHSANSNTSVVNLSVDKICVCLSHGGAFVIFFRFHQCSEALSEPISREL